MTSIDTIVAQLRRAVDHLNQAVEHLREARDMAEEIRDQCEALGVRDLVERMRHVADRAAELEALLVAGVAAGERLIIQTEAIRHGGGSGDLRCDIVPADGGAVAPGTPANAPQQPNMPRLTNAAFGDIIDRLPPRAAKRGPTWGQAFDEAGDPTGEPIRSSGMITSRTIWTWTGSHACRRR